MKIVSILSPTISYKLLQQGKKWIGSVKSLLQLKGGIMLFFNLRLFFLLVLIFLVMCDESKISINIIIKKISVCQILFWEISRWLNMIIANTTFEGGDVNYTRGKMQKPEYLTSI